MEHLLHYATKRIGKLESMLLVNMIEAQWPDVIVQTLLRTRSSRWRIILNVSTLAGVRFWTSTLTGKNILSL